MALYIFRRMEADKCNGKENQGWPVKKRKEKEMKSITRRSAPLIIGNIV